MSDHSNSPAKGEKALFRAYLLSPAPAGGGNVIGHFLARHEPLGLNVVMRDMVHGIINGDPEPLSEIDFAIQELSGLIANLQQLKEGFERFKQKDAA